MRRPRLPLSRTTLGLAVFAGLAWLAPAPAARAQFSYGYDSFVGYPQSQTYWYNAGYSGVYNDSSVQVFANDSMAGPRGVAPYQEPPYGRFGAPANRLGLTGRPGPVVVGPLRPLPPARRRGVIGRARGR